MLGQIVTSLIGATAEYFKGKQEAQKQKREVKAEINKRRMEIIRQASEERAKWEIAQIEARDSLLRRVSFFLLSTPIVGAFIFPGWVERAFSQALGAVPDWYVGMYVGMIGAIWGLREFQAGRGK